MATRQSGRRGVNLLARETLEYQLHQDHEAGEFSLLARIVLSDASAREAEISSKAQSSVDDLINCGRDREGEISARISGKFGEGDIRWLLARLSGYCRWLPADQHPASTPISFGRGKVLT